jgi:hypothetical protein
LTGAAAAALALLPAWPAAGADTPPSAIAQGATADGAPAGRSAAREGPKWGPHIDLEGKLGNDRDLGEADVFVPLWQSATSLLFGNVKARLDDNASREGNFGLGFRHMLDGGWNLGAYGYYDRRRTETHNFFSQGTFGAEALSLDWDLRANAYVPLGDRMRELTDASSSASSTAAISGTTVQVTTTAAGISEERALRGFDAELGWRVPVFGVDAGRTLRLYGGAYRFYTSDVSPVQGPRARVELIIDEVPGLWDGARLTLGGEAQHDGPRGATGFATARLRIPLQVFAGGERPRLTALERRMADPVVRDIDIVSQSRKVAGTSTVETATQTSGGSAITVLSSSSTTGAALPGAVTTAGNNSTVILTGTFNTTATVTLASGQTVMGSGTITVSTSSGKTASLTTSSATISSTVSGNAAAVDLAANSTFTGMTVNQTATGGANPQPFGVRINNVTGATISNNTITVTSTTGSGIAFGVRVLDGSGTVSNNTVSVTTSGAATGAAIAVQVLDTGTATTATVSGNTLSASGVGGSRVANVNGAVAGVTLTSSTGNVNSGGSRLSGGTVTGAVSFTNATTCP